MKVSKKVNWGRLTYERSTLALTGVGGHTSEAPWPKLR